MEITLIIVKGRHMEVLQKHSFAEEIYTLRWQARCEYAPQVGEILNVAFLSGKIESISNTIYDEGFSLDYGANNIVEVTPSALAWKVTVQLEFGYKHAFRVESIFEELSGARHLSGIDSYVVGGKSWNSTTGWSGV